MGCRQAVVLRLNLGSAPERVQFCACLGFCNSGLCVRQAVRAAVGT